MLQRGRANDFVFMRYGHDRKPNPLGSHNATKLAQGRLTLLCLGLMGWCCLWNKQRLLLRPLIGRNSPTLLCHSVSSFVPFDLLFSPLDASKPIRPPDKVISIGLSTENASASLGACSRGCTTKSNPYKSVKIDPTNAQVKPIPTTRISRALISSFVYLATATTADHNFRCQCDGFVFGSNAIHTFTIRTTSATPQHDCN
jgi:hypothetical protein